MRIKKTFMLGALVITALSLASFTYIPARDQNSYSIDQLPSSWKTNNSLVRALDIIIPTVVKELDASVACVDCSPGYSVSLLVDKPIILKQTVKELKGKKREDGFGYECTTTYAFKSSLAVYNNNQQGIAKVMITNPEVDEFIVKKKFNLINSTTEKYLVDHATELEPSEAELVKEAEKKVYIVRDQVEKLLKRH